MMRYDWGMPWHGMVLGPVVMIAVLAATIAVAALLVRWMSGDMILPSSHRAPEKAPLDILKERYARGEIEKQEFDEKKRTFAE